MDQKVVFAPECSPSWLQVSTFLAERRFPLQMRMIDGELAFPDETPPDSWQEIRVASPHGMVSLRRENDGITLVIWGNADEKVRQAWNAVAWAIAQLSSGKVLTGSGSLSAEDYFKTADLPSELRG